MLACPSPLLFSCRGALCFLLSLAFSLTSPNTCIIHLHDFLQHLCSLWHALGHPPSCSPQVPAPVGSCVPRSCHQPVGGISPPSQTPTASSRIQLSTEHAESHFHHKNTHVLPQSHTVVGTAWPERSRQLSP